jgi:DNA-binding NarL/FixJ family response regulator
MPPASILLADDHDLFREGLASLINAQPDLQVAGQAIDGLEALAMARELHPDLIVMDIQMPVCDGLEATRLILDEWSEARIIILTVHDEDEKLFEAVKAGASGYILKNTNSVDFLNNLREALSGGAPLPPRLARRLIQEFGHLSNRTSTAAAPIAPSQLTSRELEILDFLAAGLADKEIAAALSLSLHTVKTHVRNILSKLHAVNRRHAAETALREGWIKKKSEK